MTTERNEGWLARTAEKCARMLGLDRAIAYTVGARICSILGSVGTVLLIVHFLSSVEQGYYYTLLSMVNLQVIFELGFSVVILQMAAHECVHVTLHEDGRIEGSQIAHARLASVFQKTVRWYLGAAVLMLMILPVVGALFFSRRSGEGAQVAWQGPWAATVLFCVVLFFLNPLSSFIEGCGEVRRVARMRLCQALGGIAAAWITLMLHRGLYAPAMVIVAYIVVALGFIWKRERLLLGLLRYRSGEAAVSWRNEVWSFQWKIGVSSLCSYFTIQVFTPALFLLRGPVEAGQMGMSINIAGYLWTVVLAWMSTKATPFGQMIARGEFDRLDRSFFRTLWQAVAVLGVLVLACMFGVFAIQHILPKVAARMVSPSLFVLLLLTSLSTLVVQSEALYLRAHKREPFLMQSLVVAGLTLFGVLILVPRWGVAGSTVTYFISSGVIAIASATVIFRKWRKVAHTRRDAMLGALEA
jgi:O-antigen/teichoic acid export membrane protein